MDAVRACVDHDDRATLSPPALAALGRMAAYGTLTLDLLQTYAGGQPLDQRLIAACEAWMTACGTSGSSWARRRNKSVIKRIIWR